MLAGKKPKKLGDCQWVMPGRMIAVDVAQHGVERFALLRWSGRQFGADLARIDLGQDGQRRHAFEVIRDPIHGGMAVAAEFLRRHVRGR